MTREDNTRIIFDTNILIYSEDHKILSQNLQGLLKILRKHGHEILIHPASFKDINNDPDHKRRKIILSKLKAYPQLESPPIPTSKFSGMVGKSLNPNEITDNEILFAVYKNCADFMITEDKNLHKKALRTDLEDRVLSVESALDYFKRLYARKVPKHTLLKQELVRNLDINDPFFDSLKEDYEGFSEWFKKISIEGRKCWIYHEGNNKIKALMILKEENEPILTTPPLPTAKRLKICTLKVDLPGFKMGELLLKISFQYCINNQIFETYLTHHRKEEDGLIHLLEEFGFEIAGTLENNEEVYLKRLVPKEKDIPPIELAKKYYPSFKDGKSIKKFIIPIRPEFHERLFPDYQKRQIKITEYSEINIQGNTIKKAYLSHSKIKKIESGSIMLFYRSRDQRRITSVGITEHVYPSVSDANHILRIVGKRSVYSYEEIEDMAKKPVLVIVFRHHFNLPKPLNFKELKKDNILNFAPQSIIEISNDKYEYIKRKGGLDERFTVD